MPPIPAPTIAILGDAMIPLLLPCKIKETFDRSPLAATIGAAVVKCMKYIFFVRTGTTLQRWSTTSLGGAERQSQFI
jgi:hypothetical protein